jgi:hypothetical protein
MISSISGNLTRSSSLPVIQLVPPMIGLVVESTLRQAIHSSEGCFKKGMYMTNVAPLLRRRSGNAPWRARPSLPEGMSSADGTGQRGCDGAERGTSTCERSPDLQNLPYLHNVALFVMRQSCGEGFLIQPRLKNMDSSEYR